MKSSTDPTSTTPTTTAPPDLVDDAVGSRVRARVRGIVVVAVFAAFAFVLGRLTAPETGEARQIVVADRAGEGAIAVWIRKLPGERPAFEARYVLSRRPLFGVDFEHSTIHFKAPGSGSLSFPVMDGVLLVDEDGAVAEVVLPRRTGLHKTLFELCPRHPREPATVSFETLRGHFASVSPRLSEFWE